MTRTSLLPCGLENPTRGFSAAHIKEVAHMSEQSEQVNDTGLPRLDGNVPRTSVVSYRNLPVKMSDDTRAQLEVLAQLNQRSLTEETRLAVEHWVESSKSDPKVLQRAEAVRAEIERDAETKRNAIAAVLGGASDAKAEAGKPATPKPAAKPARATA
ncbi:MAG TPA: hypothetical protein VL294_11440 [Pseudolysinimonas sp.]|nr:hypothetical protein [Pseudolysinimonas sp.]